MKLLVIWVQTKKEVDFGLDMPVFCLPVTTVSLKQLGGNDVAIGIHPEY